MAVLALQIITAGLLGLWVPLTTQPVLWVMPLAVAAWWFTGVRGLLSALVFCAALAAGTAYHDETRSVEGYHDDVLVSGCVTGFPRVSEHRTAFLFTPVSRMWPRRIYVAIYDGVYSVRPGACYDLMLRVRPAHGQGNFGQFDREIWLYRSGITATAYVRAAQVNRVRADLQPPPLFALRARLRAQLMGDAGLPGSAALLRGLVLGDRSGITPEHWAVLRATGTTHLIAISGMHVGMVAAAFGFCGWFVAHALRGPPALLAAASGSMAAFVYALLAGWSVPTSRAACMFLVCSLLWLGCRTVRPLHVLGLAAISAILADPVVLLHPGFWMSYLAVLLLLTAPGPKLKRLSGIAGKSLFYIYSLLTAQWRLTLGLLVPGLWLFGIWAPLAPLVNLVAIPVFSFLLLPLVLFAAIAVWLGLPGAAWLMKLAADFLAGCIQALESAVALSGAGLLTAPGAAAVATLIVGSALALYCSGRSYVQVAACALILPVLLSPRWWNWRPAGPELQVDILDVGQGTALLVRTRNHALLADTGPAWRGGDSGAMTVLPVLQAAGVTELDLLLISHPDNDHAGGAVSVLDGVHVDSVMASSATGLPDVMRCRRGMSWQWDGVAFRILHPRTVAGWSRNNASCVLSVRLPGAHVLLPGDIETAAESLMLARGDALAADLVIVPHHGSDTSSGEAWVNAVAARFAVYTTGYRNRWGFPDAQVSARWAGAGSCELNTAYTGQLTFSADGGAGLQPESAYKAYLLRPAAVRYAVLPACSDP